MQVFWHAPFAGIDDPEFVGGVELELEVVAPLVRTVRTTKDRIRFIE